MGTIDFSKPIISTLNTNMKFFIIAAVLVASVFAEPEAEADPNAWYASYGYAGFPYYGYGSGLAYAGAYAPYTYGAYGYAGYPYAAGYNGYALGAAHLIGKRSADADAEAKPWLAYANYGYAGYPYAYAGAYSYPYATYGLGYNGYALGAHYIGKRSAEAKPESWYGYGYAPYSYSHAYAPYAYGAYNLGYGYGGYAYGK